MKSLLVMAGGTGGHVYPALAVAELLRSRGVSVTWLGTRQGLEARVVPTAGFPIDWVSIRGLRGHGISRWLVTPFLLMFSLVQAGLIILKRKPGALLGMGGFASGPGGVAGWLMRRPLLLHEQNSIAGTTNRYLAKLAKQVMTGFPNPRGLTGTEHTGNPVRVGIAQLETPQTRISEHKDTLRILVVGGSQGARVLNETVPEALRLFVDEKALQLWHQCGKDRAEQVRQAYTTVAVDARVDEFIEDMAEAYAWADVVVARSGAMTVSELAAVGVASILVPFPYAIDDHQTHNALFLANNDAAILLPGSEFNAQALYKALLPLIENKDRVLEMAINARALAKPEATEHVAQRCMEVLGA